MLIELFRDKGNRSALEKKLCQTKALLADARTEKIRKKYMRQIDRIRSELRRYELGTYRRL